MKSAARRYKEHNAGVQQAWEAHYGVGVSPVHAPISSRRVSADSTKSTESSSPSVISKAWTGIKQHAIEHHHSVNNAFDAVYGDYRVQAKKARVNGQFA